jgi:hypothetical protein
MMARQFQDPDFVVWEAYLSASRFGYPEQPRMIFNCLTDRNRRPRFLEFDGDQVGADRVLGDAGTDRLLELFGASSEID